jgi:hypothetical protein
MNSLQLQVYYLNFKPEEFFNRTLLEIKTIERYRMYECSLTKEELKKIDSWERYKYITTHFMTRPITMNLTMNSYFQHIPASCVKKIHAHRLYISHSTSPVVTDIINWYMMNGCSPANLDYSKIPQDQIDVLVNHLILANLDKDRMGTSLLGFNLNKDEEEFIKFYKSFLQDASSDNPSFTESETEKIVDWIYTFAMHISFEVYFYLKLEHAIPQPMCRYFNIFKRIEKSYYQRQLTLGDMEHRKLLLNQKINERAGIIPI